MPCIVNKNINPEIHLLVWQLTETVDELASNLVLSLNQKTFFDNILHPQKKLEYLAGLNAINICAKKLGISFISIEKDKDGKPFLKDCEWEISISHTVDFVGVVFRKTHAIGIDIEKPQDKMLKILNRIFSEKELELINNNLEVASVFWSAKEALYKLYGKRKVDFIKNLELYWKGPELLGKIKMLDQKTEHNIWIEKLQNYYIVVAY
jgi:4'-phosphopantetheinyl transferase